MKQGLYPRVLAGFGLALAPVLAFLVFEFRLETAWLERTHLEHQLATAEVVAFAIDRQIDASVELAWAIALDRRVALLETPALDAYLETLLARAPLVTTLVVFDPAGGVLGHASVDSARPEDPAVAGEGWFRRALAAVDPVVAEVFVDGPRVIPGVLVAVPVRTAAGDPLGVVVVSTDERSLGAQYRQLTFGADLAIALTDHEGTLAFHTALSWPTPAQRVAYRDFAPMRAALSGTPTMSARHVSPVLGDERLGAFVRSGRHGWGVSVTSPRDVALAPLRKRQRLELAALAGSATITLALGIVVAGILVWPLRELDAAARALGRGDLSRRVRVRTDDEIGRVAASFNEMAERLGQRTRDLERSQEEFRALNTELEERVRARTEELEHINRELEAFGYSVSHDLRAPLRAIDGFVAAVLADYAAALPTGAAAHLERARAGARRMSGLIDGLLALSRAARAPLLRIQVDMAALAREACDEAVLGVQPAPSITIGPLPPACGDPVLLRQVLSNLVRNAVKYTRGRADPSIEVGYDPGPPGAWFVRDNGLGFDPARAQALFQPFQRLEQPAEFEGYGIGLAIVQRVVARHGGRVWATSAPGEGATFSFTIGCGGGGGSPV